MRRITVSFLALILAAAALWVFAPSCSPVGTPECYAHARFGSASMRLEYATTTEARAKGLGGRTALPSDYGMLFVFPSDGLYGFWMKGMLLPLDIFWLDDKGHVVYMAEGVATSTYPGVFYPTEAARYVLETAAGFGRAHGIATGTPLVLKKMPTVSQ